MRKVVVSLKLADALREYLDERAGFNPKPDSPTSALRAYRDGKFSDEEFDKVWDFLWAKSLRSFIEGKEGLIIPDEVLKHLRELFHSPDVIDEKMLRDLASALLGHRSTAHLAYKYEVFYKYRFIESLEGMVRRAFKVRTLFASSCPPARVLRACREAFQCYLQGYHNASATLLRSVIEGVLKDATGRNIGSIDKLNKSAAGDRLYGAEIERKIDLLNQKANDIVHGVSRGRTASENENLRLIDLAQDVLTTLLPIIRRQSPT